jgi:hypothetical protein
MIARNFKLSAVFGIFALIATAFGSVAFAGPPTISTTAVNDLVNGGTVAGASSMITRTDQGVTVSVKTTVNPGAYTMWLLIWNNPENCHGNPVAPDLNCVPGPPPLFDPPSCVLYGAGHVVGNNGKLNYTAHRQAWDATDNIGGACPNGLTNPRGADVHAAVRTHGEKIPGMVSAQIHTVGGGCGPKLNECSEVQAAEHKGPLP